MKCKETLSQPQAAPLPRRDNTHQWLSVQGLSLLPTHPAATVCGGFCSSPLSQTFAPAPRGLITSLNLCSVDFHGLGDSSINGALRAHSCARQGLRMTGPLGLTSSVSLTNHEIPNECQAKELQSFKCLYCYTKQNKN